MLKVPGIGPKIFEQAAGFLRIRNGDNPLDMTAVHPESYPVVEQMAETLGASVDTNHPRAAVAGEGGQSATHGGHFYARRYSG